MTTALVPVAAPGALAVPRVDVLSAFLAGRNPRTLRAYSRDLDDFARFGGMTSAASAVETLLSLSHGDANAAALAYRAGLQARGLSPATVARRLAALRSVVKVARLVGRVGWTLDVESPRGEKYRDTSGPGLAGWRKLWDAAVAAGDGPKARRDRAILRLLYDRGLRRGELVALDLADADRDPDAPAVSVIGKGRTERERLTVNGPTRLALADWIYARGADPGPLFVRLDRGAVTPDRLTGEGVRLIVRGLGAAAGLARPARPHGLRHASITAALDMTGGNVRDVAKFSRHRDVRTLMIYDDRRADVGGEITRRLGGE
jgi:integrase/recombinase XerC